ncbi:hypothetical protein BC833DRAFT_623153 [Globomyces pollinis-pini]|nr:hypothetical protein BC833DRAFT_623153 [Globomyces pollinis-pini]
MAVMLTFIYINLNTINKPLTWMEYICVRMVVCVYLGWITAASLACLFAASTTNTPFYTLQATAGVVLGTVVELALSQYGHEPWISVMAAWALLGIATKWLTVNYTFGITTLLCSIILLIQTLQLLFFKWKTSTLGISDSAAQCSQLPLAVHVFNDKQLTAEIDKQAESFVNQETLDDIQIDFDK